MLGIKDVQVHVTVQHTTSLHLHVLCHRQKQQPGYDAAIVQKNTNFRKQLLTFRRHIIAGNIEQVQAAIGKFNHDDSQGKFADRQQEALNKPDQQGYTPFMLACKNNQPCVGAFPSSIIQLLGRLILVCR